MRTKILAILIFITGSLQSQTINKDWTKRKSVNSPNNVLTAVDRQGNVFLATTTSVSFFGFGDVTVTKYNQLGDSLWSSKFPNLFFQGFDDQPTDIATDDSGNVFVLASVSNVGKFGGYKDILLIKYNTDGVKLWHKFYNANSGTEAIPAKFILDEDANVYICGKHLLFTTGDYNISVIKYNTNGDLVWSRSYGDSIDFSYNDAASDIKLDKFNNVYVSGSKYTGETTGSNFVTLKYDSSGTLIWDRFYNGSGSGSDVASALSLDSNSNVYVTGVSQGVTTRFDAVTIKYNTAGVEQWVRIYNGLNFDDDGRYIQSEKGGDVYVGINTQLELFGKNTFTVLKYNSSGVLQWERKNAINSIGNNDIKGLNLDNNKDVFVGATLFINNTTKTDRFLVKYNSNGDSLWGEIYDSINTNNSFTDLVIDIQNNVYVAGGDVNGANNFGVVTKYSQSVVKRKPVFILPGVGATYSANIEYDMGWMLNRGIHPDSIQIDPLARVYNDLITTLENNGYVKNKDLFVVNYDWRLQPGPVDNVFDGHISGLTAQGISDNSYLYSVDYFGWYMKKAMERWRADHNEELDSIDIICHSTGGLVSRTYIQSDAYGGVYDAVNGYRLPKVKNLMMLGVPNRGASKPWNVLQDNWSGDPAYRFVLSKLINRAFQKVMQGFTITGLDHNITKASILDKDGNPDKKLFIYRYVPTLRYLVSTYPFIDFGSGLETINNDPEIRNSILLDLNNGADINAANDPNGFADSSKVSILYSSFMPTAIHSKFRDDFEFNAIHSFTDFIPRNAIPPQGWFQDLSFPSNGDGTVPTISSAGQFTSDTRVDIYEFNFTDHTAMVGKKEVQATVLDILGFDVDSSTIATGSGVSAGTILNVISDPVEIVVTDGLGRRLGYLESTGSLNEIPNSFWFGDADGIGYAYSEIVEPLNVQLTGMGENYYVMVSVEEFTGKMGGVVMQGFLEEGEQINYQITIDELKNFDAGVTAIVSPTKNQILNNSGSNISAFVKNFGSDTINNCNVFYTYNGETKGPVKVQGNLAPGDSALVTFNNAYRLKSGENIINGNLNVFIGDSGDTATNNNEKNINVSLVQPVTSFPFTEKFNNINKFPHSGDTNIWKINIATNPSGISGDSSLKADFFNNLSGTSFIYTPILNLDSLVKPVLSFYLAYTTKLSMQNDLLEVVISKDGGATIDTVVYSKDFISTPSLATVSPQNNEFIPSGISDWRNVILDLRKYSGENIVIGFRAVSAGGNNLWIDELSIQEYDDIYSIPVSGTGNYGNSDSNFIQFDITGFTSLDNVQKVSGRDNMSSMGELMISRTDTVPVNKNVNVNTIATSQSGAIFTPDYFFNRYWNVSFSGDDYNSNAVYDLIINVSEYAGDMDPGRLYLMRRKSNTDNWECVSTVTEFNGINPVNIKASNLQGFGQYAIATDESSLPVELVSFTSLVERNNVNLKWSTASEINNAGFEIERKSGLNENWVKLGFIDGFGNTNEIKNYNFDDKNLNTGRYNYRLKQIDYNGNFEYYELQSEVNVGVPDKFDLSQNYPNPFNPVTKINYDLPFDSRVMMKVYDITGREVFTLINEQKPAGYYTVQFDAGLSGNLASGVYFYRLIANGLNGQEFVLTKKMMLVK